MCVRRVLGRERGMGGRGKGGEGDGREGGEGGRKGGEGRGGGILLIIFTKSLDKVRVFSQTRSTSLCVCPNREST